MNFINSIIIHHSGGTQADSYASTLHHTWQNINEYHKQRWNFPSQYIFGQYGGYNICYDPKDRTFHQFRAIGEETAAVKGKNFDSIHICILGNYNNKLGKPPTDPMTFTIQNDMIWFISDILEGRADTRKLIIATNTELNIKLRNIHAHKFYSSTDCNGSSLDESWMRNLMINYYYQKIGALTWFIKRWNNAYAKAQRMKYEQLLAAAQDERSCGGYTG